MASESGVVHGGPASSQVSDKGLKKGAISYVSNIVIGVASTAPAYSLAATLGFIVAISGVGIHAPAVMLVSFVPILLVASPTNTSTAPTRTPARLSRGPRAPSGPGTGWLNGWAIFLADVLVMASLADIAAIYTSSSSASPNSANRKPRSSSRGPVDRDHDLDLLARDRAVGAIQQALLTAEVIILGVFAMVALVKVYGGARRTTRSSPRRVVQPVRLELRSLLPARAARGLHLLGLGFRRRGQRGVRGSGERARARPPSISTLLLVVIYLLVSTGAQAFHGAGFLANEENAEDVLNALGKGVLGEPLNKLLIICRADLGLGLDADDDPADRANDAIDGALESRAQVPRKSAQNVS